MALRCLARMDHLAGRQGWRSATISPAELLNTAGVPVPPSSICPPPGCRPIYAGAHMQGRRRDGSLGTALEVGGDGGFRRSTPPAACWMRGPPLYRGAGAWSRAKVGLWRISLKEAWGPGRQSRSCLHDAQPGQVYPDVAAKAQQSCLNSASRSVCRTFSTESARRRPQPASASALARARRPLSVMAYIRGPEPP